MIYWWNVSRAGAPASRQVAAQIISKQQREVNVVVGKTLTIECIANGWPVPEVTWSRYGGQLPRRRHQQLSGRLFSLATVAVHLVQFFPSAFCKRLKKWNVCRSQSFGASPAIWDPSITCHWDRWTCPALTPAMQVGTWFTYRRGMEGWVDLGGWLCTETVYLSADSHPSK